jgi:hypothetical protein
MYNGPVKNQCELDHTSDEFDADFGAFVYGTSLLALDNQWWADRSLATARYAATWGGRSSRILRWGGSTRKPSLCSETAEAMIRSIVVRLGRASGDWQ